MSPTATAAPIGRGAVAHQVISGATGVALELAAIGTNWIASAAFSFAEAASFALGLALASVEAGIIFLCWHVNQKLETLSAFAFALALELMLDKSSDFSCRLMHMFAPATLGALISPK